MSLAMSAVLIGQIAEMRKHRPFAHLPLMAEMSAYLTY